MSVSRGCDLIERHPGQWFCVVAMSEYDYDFRQFRVYGPKPTADEARDEMHKYTSNPGGYSVYKHDIVTDQQRARCDDLSRRDDPDAHRVIFRHFRF